MNNDMIIKVCGMRDVDNIRQVAELGINWMGFIFYPKSPRYVDMLSSNSGILPDRAAFTGQSSLDRRTLDKICRVGVFVDDMPQNIVTRVYNYGLDIVQLHGSESTVMIDNLRRTLDPDIHKGIRIMKALNIKTGDDVLRYKDYEGHVDYFLFDTKTPLAGGSGQQFDWSVLDAYDGQTPFLLSGGIGPDDAERVLNFNHPRCIGIDLNSKFETAPAMKDVDSLRTFIKQIRQQQ